MSMDCGDVGGNDSGWFTVGVGGGLRDGEMRYPFLV